MNDVVGEFKEGVTTAYAIARLKKLKQSNIALCASHANREREVYKGVLGVWQQSDEGDRLTIDKVFWVL